MESVELKRSIAYGHFVDLSSWGGPFPKRELKTVWRLWAKIGKRGVDCSALFVFGSGGAGRGTSFPVRTVRGRRENGPGLAKMAGVRIFTCERQGDMAGISGWNKQWNSLKTGDGRYW
jgi:hypothetical protein